MDVKAGKVSWLATLDLSDIEKRVTEVDNLLKKATKTTNIGLVTVSVDDSALTELNKHLDLKRDHLGQINRYFSTNPIRPKVDDSSLVALNEELDKLEERFSKGLLLPIATVLQDQSLQTASNNKFGTSVDKFSTAIDRYIAESAEQATITEEAVEVFKQSVDRQSRLTGIVGKAREGVSKLVVDNALKAINKETNKAVTSELNKAVNNLTEAVRNNENTPEQISKLINKVKPIAEPKPDETLAAIESGVSELTQLNKAVDDVLKAILKVNLSLDKPTLSTKVGTSGNTVGENILTVIPRMRGSGTRKGESVTDGGLRKLFSDMPELKQGKVTGKKVKQLQEDLKDSIQALIDDNNLEKLNNIAEYLVKNWGSLANQTHRSYVPDVGEGQQYSMNMNDPTSSINENWTDTREHIEAQLEKLVAFSADSGYEIQKNISEGSPGTTKNIRDNWDNTTNFISDRMEDLESDSASTGKKLTDHLNPSNILNLFKDKLTELGKRILAMGALGVGAFIGIGAAVSALTGMVTETINNIVTKIGELIANSQAAAIAMEEFGIKADFVFGRGLADTKLGAVAAEANSLGLSVKDARNSFVDFFSTVKGSGVESAASQMFTAFQKNVSIVGGSAEQTQRTMKALTDMLGKGKVQAEELTGQLAEALPGSLTLAANAMNMTRQELLSFVSSGRLLADEFVPKLTAEMEKMADAFLLTAPEPLGAKLQRLENLFGSLTTSIGMATIDFSKPMIDNLNTFLQFVIDYKDQIIGIAFTTATTIAAIMLKQLFIPITQYAATGYIFVAQKVTAMLGVVTAGFKGTEAAGLSMFAKLKVASTGLLVGLKAVATALLPVLGIVAAAEAIRGIIQFNNTEQGKQRQFAEDRLGKMQGASGEDQARQSAKTNNLLLDTADMLNRLIGNRTFGESFQTKREQESAQELAILEETTFRIKQLAQQAGGANKYLSERAKIEKEIEINAATINGLVATGNAEALKEAEAMRAVNVERQQELIALNKQYYQYGDLQIQLDQYNNKIQRLEELINSGQDFTGKYANQLENAKYQAQGLTNTIEANNATIEMLKNNMGNLSRELRNVDIAAQVAAFNLSMLESVGNRDIARDIASRGGISNIDDDLSRQELNIEVAKKAFDNINKELSEFAAAIKATTDEQTKTNILTILNTLNEGANIQNLADATLEQLINALESAKDLDDKQKQVLEQLRDQKQKQVDLVQAEENYYNAQNNFVEAQRDKQSALRNYLRSAEDLQLSIDDFYINTTRQLEDFALDNITRDREFSRSLVSFNETVRDFNRSLVKGIEANKNAIIQATAELDFSKSLNDLKQSIGASQGSLFKNFTNVLKDIFDNELSLQGKQLTLEEQRLQQEEESLNISRQVRAINEQREDLELQRFQSLRDLSRQQEDFTRSQVESMRSISQQIQDMELEAESMGIDFTSIAESINQASILLEQTTKDLAEAQNNAKASISGGMLGYGFKASGLANPLEGIDFASTAQQTSGFYAPRSGGRTHFGADYYAKVGTAVASAISGEVISVYDDKGEFGLKVKSLDGTIIQHMNHMKTLTVKVGDMIQAGQQIGTSGGARMPDGSRGSFGSTGAHLDLKFQYKGRFIPVEELYRNPQKYISADMAKAFKSAPPVEVPTKAVVKKAEVKELKAPDTALPDINIPSLGTDKVNDKLVAEKLVTDEQKLQLEQESLIEQKRSKAIADAEKLASLHKDFKNQMSGIFERQVSLNQSIQDYLFNADGVLSIEEQRTLQLTEMNNKYNGLVKEAQSYGKELKELFSTENLDQKAFDSLIENMKELGIDQATIDPILQIKDDLEAGAIQAENINKSIEGYVTQITKAAEIAQKTQEETFNLEKQIQGLDTLSSLYGTIAQKQDDLVSSGNPYEENQFKTLSKVLAVQAEYKKQFQEIARLEKEYKDDSVMVEYLQSIKGEFEKLKDLDLKAAAKQVSLFEDAVSQPLRNAFEGLVDGIGKGTLNLKDIFRDVLTSIADFFSNLAGQLFQNALFGNGGLLSGLLGGGTQTTVSGGGGGLLGGIGNIIGGFFGGGSSLLSGIGGGLGIFNSGSLSFMADGGNVSPNKPYVVGEEGMELFIPKTPGVIIPNNRLNTPSYDFKFNPDAMQPNNRSMSSMVNNQRVTKNYNIYAKDVDSFVKSSSMIAQDLERKENRASQFK